MTLTTSLPLSFGETVLTPSLVLLGSISPTFYGQLLCPKIPKAQKETDNLTFFLSFWGSAHVKVAHKHVGEIDPYSVTYYLNCPIKR